MSLALKGNVLFNDALNTSGYEVNILKNISS